MLADNAFVQWNMVGVQMCKSGQNYKPKPVIVIHIKYCFALI